MLDNIERLKKLDPQKMMSLIYNLPEQCQDAIKIAKQAVVGWRFSGISNIVITGMGGSAISGDLLRMFLTETAGIPIFVNRDYVVPKFVDERTLVIASSYSGNTEETLSAYEDAKQKGAKLAAITTGGKLKEKASKDGIPLIIIPPGLSPRAAIGYSFMPLLVFVQHLGVFTRADEQINDAINTLLEAREVLNPDVPAAKNPAKTLAKRIYGRLPIIYASTRTTEAIALRWKGQISENAKSPAYFNVFPELNHNEIVGWALPEEVLKMFVVVILRDDQDHERIKKRIEITKELINNKAGGIAEIWADGNSSLARMFYLIMFGDYVSLYLAFLNGVDPTPVKAIDLLKKKLAENR